MSPVDCSQTPIGSPDRRSMMEAEAQYVEDEEVPIRTGDDDPENPSTPEKLEENPLYWQIGKSLGGCMLRLYLSKTWTDVTFRCKGHDADYSADIIHAHKVVLAARSPFFQGMFYGPCAERGEVELLTTEADIFDLVLRYMYSDETSLNEGTACRVLELANMYQLPSLVEYCADFLATVIRAENVCEILDLALLYKQSKLRDTAFVFIDKHAQLVLDSDGFLRITNECLTQILKGDTLWGNEERIFQRAMEWAECKLSDREETIDGPKKRDALSEAFFYLRVPILDNLGFIRCSKGEKCYTLQEMTDIMEYINDKGCTTPLCHSAVTRAPLEVDIHVPNVKETTTKPTDLILYRDISLLKTNVEKIECIVLLQVSKDCLIHGLSLHKNIVNSPVVHVNGYTFKRDSLVDATVDVVFRVYEIQYQTEFQLRRDKVDIVLEKALPLKQKDTPYIMVFVMKYRSEHSVIQFEAEYNSRSREKCKASNHTQSCLYMLQNQPGVGGFKAGYCNGTEHVNCIESIEIHNLPNRNRESSGATLSVVQTDE